MGHSVVDSTFYFLRNVSFIMHFLKYRMEIVNALCKLLLISHT